MFARQLHRGAVDVGRQKQGRRGRGSQDLRAVLAGRVLWLLPNEVWAFPGGKGCMPEARERVWLKPETINRP